MAETAAGVLAIPGLIPLILWSGVAGAVYGFAGFGAALVFMPVAVALVPPALAVAAFNLGAVISLATVVPRAWGEVDRRGVSVMIAAACVTASAGLWVLRSADLTALRWAVLAVTAVTLAALVAGWRYRAAPGLGTKGAVGAAAGFVGGATGLPGPVMVLFQLAGQDSLTRSRATAVVFLTVTSLALVPLMALQGMLTGEAVALGLMLMVPYGLGTLAGQAVFREERARLYRGAAYGIIAAAIVMGLPVWEG